jgi:hypothetical protein
MPPPRLPLRPTKLRRYLKTVGAVCCVLILLAAVLSIRGSADWTSKNECYMVSLAVGDIWVDWDYELTGQQPELQTGWHFRWRDTGGFIWWPRWEFSRLSGFFAIPLWMLFLACALGTGYFWRHGRRRVKPGHCQQCGYRLDGLPESRCPECGVRFDRKCVEGNAGAQSVSGDARTRTIEPLKSQSRDGSRRCRTLGPGQ